ncbi:rab3 GTPase-activating protein catalytic subunit isoform X2 [Carex littledalei]|uniref:Rab3 GTPase-activating protein catalytic subunit n=1 Tax=Carex littledalei TaxID=544730 RepID=A0A833VRA8_9POAL|nr:rab3 GTPase-activating protein catalytic subunit isoform X2 [Carex littledalei]
MASSSSSKHRKIGEEEEEEDEEEDTVEEFEVFDDFTIASSWERFISDIEASCRQWLADGSKNLVEKGAESLGRYKNLYRVKKELKYGGKTYSMEFNFVKPVTARASCWDDDLHNMQLSFGVDDFLVIAPQSANGVVLDDPESTKLLSSVAIALSNCGSNWPAFVPVHDPSRKAYNGIQNMGANFTRRFEADRIATQVPIRLMHLEGLYELFVSKFVLSTTDFSTNYFKVQFAMRLSYETPPYDYNQEEILESEIDDSVETETSASSRIKKQWDEDCPWTEWYSAEDPIRGFDLVAIWRSRTIEGSLEMAELENTSSFDAEHWLLSPIVSQDMVDDSIAKFVGFAPQIGLLISALDASFEAQFLEDFVAAENTGLDNSKSTANVPPPSVLDRVLKELFQDGTSSSANVEVENRNSRAVKGAPLQSLFAQFCLHALWFGNCNIRAIAVLWIDFVREIRWYWEESEPLPRVPGNGTIDLSSCILHQKLQMLAICIERKRSRENDQSFFDCEKEDENSSNKVKVQKDLLTGPSIDNIDSSSKHEYFKTETELAKSSDQKKVDKTRRGSAGVVRSMMLLNSFEEMHAPYTQSAPLMTEDMHEERLHAVEALGNTMGSGQLEKDILSSDMSAFKAANPNAVFEDFIRWHSPGDWETEGSSINKLNWPPKGRLSQRMSEHGNMWRKIWNESPAMPISEQKPLLDPVREGEKIMHYLETLRPQQLLEQMVCTAFRACADILNQTSYGGFKLMKTKMDQLYLTLGSSLKSLQGNQHDKDELIGDLKQLCTVFEHIEKLVILAASISRKLADTPRLSEAIFTDYFNFYLPKMGTGLTSICYDKEFDSKQEVKMRERDAVAGMFPPPTANQSWRKVLSMGNLLNGHEPTQREIIFSVNDAVSNGHYGSKISVNGDEDVETYRMYICGTSNDLWAALSVTSWD